MTFSRKLIQATMAGAVVFLAAASGWTQVTLVSQGRLMATIVVPDPEPEAPDGRELPPATARKAAEELKKYIARSSGAELPIVPAAQAPPDGTLVLVGRSTLTEQFGLAMPDKSGGVRITTFPRGLAILGEIAPEGTNNRPDAFDRGIVNATYLFLEKCIGYRFYFNQGPDAELGMVVPELSTIEVGPIDFSSSPAFSYRAIVPGVLGSGDWQAATLAGQDTGFSCNHTHFGWDSLYKDVHPEYFSLQADGSRDFRFLCYGNPDVLKREIEHTETYYQTGRRIGGAPGEKHIPVEPADNWAECQCKVCQSLIDPSLGRFAKHSRLWWDTYIRQFAAAAKERWPDKRIAALAYQARLSPGKADLPDNVDVMACIHNAPVTFYKEPSARAAALKVLADWSEKLGNDRRRLYVWDYTCYPDYWTCAPTFYPHAQQQFLRDTRSMIEGLFINGGDEIVQADHLMVAITFRLLWDPDLDVDAYINDYCQRFFGPAARPMEQLYRLMIQRFEEVRWPDYHQPSHTAWASPTMFYGHTYTPEVIERIEQLLCEAQEAAGPLPGGRAAVEFDGEGWFVRRNAGDGARPFEVVIEATGKPVHFPTIQWDGGQVVYRDTLVRGQKLVVRAGPKAMLIPVEPPPSKDWWMTPAKRLADGLKAFPDAYLIHGAHWLNMPAYPGAKYRITVTGKAEDGANSLVAVQWGNPDDAITWHLQNQFGSDVRTVSEVVTAPEDATQLKHLLLYRGNQKGTVWYGHLSIRPEFDPPGNDLPPEGKEVTSRIEGDAPIIGAHTSRLFHVFSDSVGMAVRHAALDLHVGAGIAPHDRTPDGGDMGKGGTLLRVSVEPASESSGNTKTKEPTIYQRRIAWMRDGWENFHPQSSMYSSHDGFLVEARTAQKWIGRTPEYRVPWVESAPPQDLTDPAWANVPVTTLVRGRSNASVPVDNVGFGPGNAPTEIRIVQDKTNIYAAFLCIQPEKPNEQNSVTLTLYGKDKPVISVTCRPDQAPETEAAGVASTTASEPGWWAAFVTIPKSAIPGGLQSEHRADLLRTRKSVAYLWSPPLAAPWTDMPSHRRGKMMFGDR